MESLPWRGANSEEEERAMIVEEMSNYPFQFSPASQSSHSKGMFGRCGRQMAEEDGSRDRAFPSMDRMELSIHQSLERERNCGSREGACSSSSSLEREHMFDKVVTPSDVGKLNRLVIPKQYAEKYFPLDSSANEKGLLLNFEDLTGKMWRFRYSYWNSSQSYVMTKGWSRFVKEKKLDAGDIISFERGAAESAKDRLYIDWKRRPNAPPHAQIPHPLSLHRSIPWSRIFLPHTLSLPAQRAHPYLQQQQLNYGLGSYGGSNGYGVVSPSSVFYLQAAAAAAAAAPGQLQHAMRGGQQATVGNANAAGPSMVFDSVPVVQSNAAVGKRLRLFGVNLDCSAPEDADCQVLSSSAAAAAIHHSFASSLPPTTQLGISNGDPPSARPEERPKKGKGSLSLDLDI
ncbi:hypothetical protein ACLOJK_032116 [Asimina triloba]